MKLSRSRLLATLPRLVALGLGYAGLTSVSFILAYLLRFDFSIPDRFEATLPLVLIWSIPIRLVCLYAMRQFHFVLRSFSAVELPGLIVATGVSTLAFLAIRMIAGIEVSPPRGVVAIEGILFVGLVAGTRLLLRETPYWFGRRRRNQKNVVIIGGGNAGEQLVEQFRRDSSASNRVIAFFDDNPDLNGKRIGGIRIHAPIEVLEPFTLTHSIDRAIVAMPSAPIKRVREIVGLCQHLGIECARTPSLVDILTGKERIDRITRFQPEDFLNREPVSIDVEMVRRFCEARNFLVTGAGGSIGSEICRQLIALGANRVVAVDRSEPSVFNLSQTLQDDRLATRIVDISRTGALDPILRNHRIEVCFHAAAFKHVPLMEEHPIEAFENNCIGTLHTIDSCREHGVQRFCFISTDKVVAPSNVMGLTKKIGEDLVIGGLTGLETCAVRFGNVLDSSGSVIPIFKQQIANGGPVTVTDPEVTRYFMTIPEAVGLVLNTTAFAEPGSVYVLDMGDPVSIDELARAFIAAHGLRPGIDIAIQYTGLRPGEKLHESLHLPEEELLPTPHPQIRRIRQEGVSSLHPAPGDWSSWLEVAKRDNGDPQSARNLFFKTFCNPKSGRE